MKKSLNVLGCLLSAIGLFITIFIEFVPLYLVISIAMDNGEYDVIFAFSWMILITIFHLITAIMAIISIFASRNPERYKKQSKVVLATSIMAIIGSAWPIYMLFSNDEQTYTFIIVFSIIAIILGALLMIFNFVFFKKQEKFNGQQETLTTQNNKSINDSQESVINTTTSMPSKTDNSTNENSNNSNNANATSSEISEK